MNAAITRPTSAPMISVSSSRILSSCWRSASPFVQCARRLRQFSGDRTTAAVDEDTRSQNINPLSRVAARLRWQGFEPINLLGKTIALFRREKAARFVAERQARLFIGHRVSRRKTRASPGTLPTASRIYQQQFHRKPLQSSGGYFFLAIITLDTVTVSPLTSPVKLTDSPASFITSAMSWLAIW